MPTRQEYATQIIEKVGSEKILEIIYSKKVDSPVFKKKKKYTKPLILLSLPLLGLLEVSNIININVGVDNINYLIHLLSLWISCMSIITVPFIFFIFLGQFLQSFKKGKGFLKNLKYAYYNFKESFFTRSNIAFDDLSYELFLEISKHFSEKEMLKIVNLKLKNKDLFVYSMSSYDDEKYKAFQVEQIENNLGEFKEFIEEYDLNKMEVAAHSKINKEFASSLYLKK